ncbi:biotin--[acetyl-CoA-carboxylase] ligase [Segatella asaccharophila]|jgi:BirA family biotin operon repressor/biotin-[acetyl-CoA-carboxylase] ligase
MMKTKIIKLKETDSTISYLKNYQPQVDEEMTVVVADYQSAGRGQGTNSWESDPGKNLLFSILVHPVNVPVARQFLLSMAGAVALKQVLDQYAGVFTMKWPNDIYWRDKKISGTLIDTSLSRQHIRDCIFGIGIDVNQTEFHSDAPNPISLCQITGKEISREDLLKKIIKTFQDVLKMIDDGDYTDIAALYHQSLYHGKGYHRFQDQKGIFEAGIVEVEDDGHLVLHDHEGVIREYAFKEVRFLD